MRIGSVQRAALVQSSSGGPSDELLAVVFHALSVFSRLQECGCQDSNRNQNCGFGVSSVVARALQSGPRYPSPKSSRASKLIGECLFLDDGVCREACAAQFTRDWALQNGSKSWQQANSRAVFECLLSNVALHSAALVEAWNSAGFAHGVSLFK